nr:MAG: putative capsid protein [Arizlama virus]
MSSRKRSYPNATNPNKASRMVGGRVLTYRPSAPLAGSYRSRQLLSSVTKKPELYGVDTALTLTPIISTTNTNASMFTVNLIAPGNGSFNRRGRKICMKSLRIRGIVDAQCTYQAISTTMHGGTMRMVVVYDKQPSGVLPTWDTIFGLTDQAGTETSSVYAPVRYDNTDRFVVLRDKQINLNPEGMVATGGVIISPQFTLDEYIKLPNLETVYSGQSATCTIADISSGALYILFRVHEDASGSFTAVIPSNTYARLRYMDN